MHRPAILLLLLMLLAPAVSRAEPTIGVYFDPEGTRTTWNSTPFAWEKFWVVGFELPAVDGFAFSLRVDSRLAVFGKTILPGVEPTNTSDLVDNWVVELGGCLTPVSGPVSLVEYRFLTTDHADRQMLICIEPAEGSQLDPPTPGYRSCSGEWLPIESLRTVPGLDPGCAVVNLDGAIIPNGGEIWPVGSTQTVSWTLGEAPLQIGWIEMQYSTDGGASWERIYPVSVGADYEWIVPDTPTTDAFIRVIHFFSYVDGDLIADLLAQSEGAFSIVPGVAVDETSWGDLKTHFDHQR